MVAGIPTLVVAVWGTASSKTKSHEGRQKESLGWKLASDITIYRSQARKACKKSLARRNGIATT